MSKVPLGYTEASGGASPAAPRPDQDVQAAAPEATGAFPAAEPSGHKDRMKDHRILVVDDEPASRKGLQDLLGVWGYDVSSAGDGQEALERAAGRAPDLVIADLVMPGIDGMELLARFKHDFPTTAVVFLTGQGRRSRTALTTISPSPWTRRAFSSCSTGPWSGARPSARSSSCVVSCASAGHSAGSWERRGE